MNLLAGFSPLQDGEEELLVDGVHDQLGFTLLAWLQVDVQDPHAPGSGKLFTLIKAVLQVCYLVRLVG